MVTTNPVYRCEELEDADAAYDDIQENDYNLYDDLNEENTNSEVLSTENGGYDQGSTPKDQNEEQNYESPVEQTSDHIHVHMPNDETEGRDEESRPEHQD